jgi:hypothetical protein
MSMTLPELKEALIRDGDTVYLLDLLDIPYEQLVELLSDKIEEKFDVLVEEFDLTEESDYD